MRIYGFKGSESNCNLIEYEAGQRVKVEIKITERLLGWLPWPKTTTIGDGNQRSSRKMRWLPKQRSIVWDHLMHLGILCQLHVSNSIVILDE